jgi:hypothetical protein
MCFAPLSQTPTNPAEQRARGMQMAMLGLAAGQGNQRAKAAIQQAVAARRAAQAPSAMRQPATVGG